MKISVARLPLVYILIFGAKILAFVESRFFVYVVQVLLIFGLAYLAAQGRSGFDKSFKQVRADIKTLVWCKTLPRDYFQKQEQESQLIYAKYLEAVKPKPPKKNADIPFPYVSARSYIIVDVLSNTVLGSKDADVALPPASTAKLATALASLKLYKIDEEVAVPQFCTQIEGTKAEFLQGQRFLVSDLLKALLVQSSADASCVLSIGKSSYAEFITLMNDVAREAGLQNTKFTNPVGLDDAEGGNLSSAENLAKLGKVAMENGFIKEAVQLKDFELKDLDGKYSKKLSNTNRLLTEIPGTVGIKTGTTTGAGEVLIYEYARDKRDLIIVVMGSSDRFSDTKNVLSWTLGSFTWD